MMEENHPYLLMRPLQKRLLRGDGRESSPISLVDFGCGLAGPCSGPSCGPSALSCGEAQGFCLVSWVVLGRTPRPGHLKGPLSNREGVSGEACGPVRAVAMGEGAFYGNETPISPPRARVMQSPSKIKGGSRDASREADPLVGLSRDSTMLCSSQLMDRGHLTNEALCEEASRYVNRRFFPMGGRELSSSSLSSGLDQAGAKEGALSGLVSMVEGEEQLPLSIILADESNGELGTEGVKSSGRIDGGGGVSWRFCYRIWKEKDVGRMIAAWQGSASSASSWAFRRKDSKANC